MMCNSEALKHPSCWNSTFFSVDYWIFCFVFCSHLIQFQKIIQTVTFWNSMNLWPIWWEYVYYGHHLREFHSNPCEVFLPKLLQKSIYVVHNSGLSLMTLINCCLKILKMILLSAFWNWIKTRDHWTFNNLLRNF